MKIDRLLGIVTILLQQKQVTAPYLAQVFEVSRRTINRDIEDICKAGIPLVTTQGAGGGIAITPGYTVDRALFSPDEWRAVLTGLATLDSVAQDRRYRQMMDKLTATSPHTVVAGQLLIDLSSHYKDSLAPKIHLLESAIAHAAAVAFTYHSRRGEQQLLVDPYLLAFKWSSWYLLGMVHGGSDFKFYKLNRICDVAQMAESFCFADIPPQELDFNSYLTADIAAVVLFHPDVKYRLVEEYGVDCYTTLPDGWLRFAAPFTNEDYLLGWVLGFGAQAELLEPAPLRVKLQQALAQALKKYRE